jgi:hypothetical protein
MTKKHDAAPVADEETKNLPSTGHGGALTVAPDFMDAEDFGLAGFEGAGAESYSIPFLQILQKMSPIVDEDSPNHIEGAKAGMFYNSVTKEMYDGKEGIRLIPCAFKRTFIEWAPRGSEGSGFKGEYTPEEYDAMVERKEVSVLNGKAYRPMENGRVDEKKSNYIVDTRVHYVLLIDPKTGATSMAVLSLSSTMVKASRSLMTLLRNKVVETAQGKRTPPTFANIVRAKTISKTNAKGSWSAIEFELDGMVQDPRDYAEAKKFYKAVNGGQVKADHTKADYTNQDTGGVADDASEAENF